MGSPYLVIPAVTLLLSSFCEGQDFQCENGTITKNEADCQIVSLINARRTSLAMGLQRNGWPENNNDTGFPETKELPPAKNMKKLTYDCSVEKEAAEFVATLECAQMDNPPTEPTKGYLFSSEYTEFSDDMPTILWYYLSRIDEFAFSSADPVTFVSGSDGIEGTNLKTYANLMKGDAAKIGCTVRNCTDKTGEDITQFLCLTDVDNIKENQQVYEKGTGKKCECEGTLTCDGSGLCVEPVTTTQTPTVTTSAAFTNATGTQAAETTTLASLAEFPGSSTAEPSTWCNYSEISDTMRMHMQDTHNFRRSTLALGQVTDNTGATLPAATNMNYLHWNCTLEKQAHDFLKSCPTMGYQRPDGNSPAQNFYRGTITANEPTWRDMNKKTVTEWWKPVRKVAGPGQSVYFTSAHSSSSIKTYTLMGWARSTQMGCSIAKCGSDWVEACRYYPPGNEIGAQQYKPGKACSDCNSLGAGPCAPSLGLCDSEK